MAESTRNQSIHGAKTEEEEDDYMGDLAQFIPPEPCQNAKRPHPRKASDKKPVTIEPSRKKSKTLSWQERRKVEKERKQIEEDEQTLAKIEAAPISESNIGFKLLKQMGYMPGSALGKEGSGRAEPVSLDIRRSRAGIGREDPHKEKRKREEIEVEKRRGKEEELMADFGSRQKSNWRHRRVMANFRKAKAALDQLENKEVVPEKKDEEDEEDEEGQAGKEDEEEEEEITEEDLKEILMKLRDEYRYCPFCGFQYETMEDLLSNCPGIDEDDH